VSKWWRQYGGIVAAVAGALVAVTVLTISVEASPDARLIGMCILIGLALNGLRSRK